MSEKLRVMISSRCNDQIACADRTLTFSDLRLHLKQELENEILLSKEFLDVTLSEKMIVNLGDNSLDACLKEIKRADIVVVLYNGDAGWSEKATGGVGICRAEFEEAFNNNPIKTYVVDFLRGGGENRLSFSSSGGTIDYATMKKKERNKKYKAYVEMTTVFTQAAPNPEKINSNEYKKKIYQIVQGLVFEGIIKIFNERKTHRSKFNAGEALEWSKMNFERRCREIKNIVEESVKADSTFNNFIIDISAIPDSMSVAEARSMAGRPFLDNYRLIDLQGVQNENKVINFMAVYKNATESQMRSLIGHPDITIIKDEFGFYVWDMINQIQLITLINCRDSTSTEKQIERFLLWMKSSNEAGKISVRAEKRYNILRAIAENQLQ